MDTISSRESSGSPLPLVGVIAGVLGLVLGVVALVKVSNANKRLDEHQPKIDLVDGIKTTADAANDAATKAARDTAAVRQNLAQVAKDASDYMGALRADVDKIKEDMKKPAPSAAKGSSGPVVAGPGEYVIKSGDTFAKIARAQGVSLGDLQAVNAGVNPSKLAVGQKIKLPKK
ncbi:MAG: LysM peptidoglycan-binding domain-containing protein [Opitutaceae bacterium]